MRTSGRTTASRKYMDLIYEASTKYANWDPPKPIRVGDYGNTDRETGEFIREGNIYDKPEIKHITENKEPIVYPQNDQYVISSKHAKRHASEVGPDVIVGGFAQVSLRGSWDFPKHRGALLVMHKPRMTSLPPDLLLPALKGVDFLKDRKLVTEIYTCHAYTLYLSSGRDETVKISLSLQVPTNVPGLSAGPGMSFSWENHASSGTLQNACDPEGNDCYTPLYRLKKIAKKGLRRDISKPDPVGDATWEDAHVPWETLNSDGEEVPFEDFVPSSDDDSDF